MSCLESFLLISGAVLGVALLALLIGVCFGAWTVYRSRGL